MNENLDEELMKLAGELLAYKREKHFDRLNAEERAYSPRFRKRWERLLRRTRAGRNGRAVSGRNLLRLLAVSAAIVVLMTAAAAVPAIREAVFRTSASADTEDRVVHITLNVNENAPENEAGCEPAWIPEGYCSAPAHTNELPEYGLYSATWCPEPEHDVYYPGRDPMWLDIIFHRWPFDPKDPHTTSAAGEGYRSVKSTSVPLGPYEGQLVRTVWDIGTVYAALIWTDSRYVYTLDTCTEIVPGSSEDGVIRPLPLEDLLRMAWSVSADPGAADEAAIGAIAAIAAELEREDAPRTEGLCPKCGTAEIRAVCTHDPLRGYEEQFITGFASCGDPEHEEGCRARRTFCWTDYACPACGYGVPGTEQHTEIVIHTQPDGTEFSETACILPYAEQPSS